MSETPAVSSASLKPHELAGRHTIAISRARSRHHCSTEHKAPVGCWPASPARAIQCDHVLDRRKQKHRGTVSTSDGASPNLETSDTFVQSDTDPGFPVIHRLFAGLSLKMMKCLFKGLHSH